VVESSNRDAMILEHMPNVRYMAAALKRRMTPDVELDDLISAGTIGLIEAVDKFENRGFRFATYARYRVRGAMIDSLRARNQRGKEVRARLDENAWQSIPDDSPSPFGRYEKTELEAVINSLPDRERLIIVRFFFEGQPSHRIARQMGISEGRVSQLKSRALRTLRETLEPSHLQPLAA
jgi:RNA polymerase sigma factor for flagellar operon FliA